MSFSKLVMAAITISAVFAGTPLGQRAPSLPELAMATDAIAPVVEADVPVFLDRSAEGDKDSVHLQAVPAEAVAQKMADAMKESVTKVGLRGVANGSAATCPKPHWIGNGVCDNSLNTPECGFDGGDCCKETCVATCKYKCTGSFNTCIGDQPSMEGGLGKATDSIVYALTDEQRDSVWLMYFFEKWGYFPIQGFNEAFEKIKKKMKENGDWEKVEQAAEKALTGADNRVIQKTLYTVVAAEIVKAAVKGGKSAAGRQMAETVVSRGATLIETAESGAAAFKTVSSGLVGIVPVVAEYATTFTLQAFGVEDDTAIIYGGGVGSILGGVMSGAVVGGPVGAAVGGAVGAGSWLLEQGIGALFHTGTGPSDNWCYIRKGSNWRSSDDVNLYTYNGGDGLRWISYWSANTNEFGSEKIMSAGQAKVESFQLQVGGRLFPKVYYQDVIFVGKDTCGTRKACHCGGSFNQEKPGLCQCLNL